MSYRTPAERDELQEAFKMSWWRKDFEGKMLDIWHLTGYVAAICVAIFLGGQIKDCWSHAGEVRWCFAQVVPNSHKVSLYEHHEFGSDTEVGEYESIGAAADDAAKAGCKMGHP